jgi:hypothetical protein
MLCRVIITFRVAVVGSIRMFIYIMRFVHANVAYLDTIAFSLVVVKLLTFNTLVYLVCGQVFHCPSWLSENYHPMF